MGHVHNCLQICPITDVGAIAPAVSRAILPPASPRRGGRRKFRQGTHRRAGTGTPHRQSQSAQTNDVFNEEVVGGLAFLNDAGGPRACSSRWLPPPRPVLSLPRSRAPLGTIARSACPRRGCSSGQQRGVGDQCLDLTASLLGIRGVARLLPQDGAYLTVIASGLTQALGKEP